MRRTSRSRRGLDHRSGVLTGHRSEAKAWNICPWVQQMWGLLWMRGSSCSRIDIIAALAWSRNTAAPLPVGEWQTARYEHLAKAYASSHHAGTGHLLSCADGDNRGEARRWSPAGIRQFQRAGSVLLPGSTQNSHGDARKESVGCGSTLVQGRCSACRDAGDLSGCLSKQCHRPP